MAYLELLDDDLYSTRTKAYIETDGKPDGDRRVISKDGVASGDVGTTYSIAWMCFCYIFRHNVPPKTAINTIPVVFFGLSA